jgi:MFS family permease
MTISAAALHAVTVHIMPYLISLQFSRDTASLVAGLLVIASVVGRFGLGWLGNWMDKRLLIAFGLLLQALGLLVLSWTHSLWLAVIFIITFGPGYGGVITIRLTIQADYFGRKAFGAITGMTMAIIVIGTMTSPLLAGRIYDLLGSYRPAWLIMALAIFASIPLALWTRPPRPLKRDQ